MKKSINFSLKTERLILKVLDEGYANIILDYFLRNKGFLKEWEPQRSPEFYTARYQKAQLIDDLSRIKAGVMFKFWIFKKGENDRTIGSISFNNIVRGCFHSCFLGYRLDKDEINNGYMTEGLITAIGFMFNEIKLHRIEANIMPKNKASLQVVEKLGFYNEGLARKYLRINGCWEDHIHMVLLNEQME